MLKIAATDSGRPPKLFILSSHEQGGTERTSENLIEYLEKRSDSGNADDSRFLGRLAFTLSEGRSRLPWKSFQIASSTEELISSLKQQTSRPQRSNRDPSMGFVFTGQGAQWWAMGRQLLCYPVFKANIQQADQYLRSLGSQWSLLEELLADEKNSRINESAISQPACTALQVALVDLLGNWNIRPSVVIGHSSGEIAAAYAKKAISKEAAWKIAYHRGRLSSTLRSNGAMLAVALGEEGVEKFLRTNLDGITVIACINSPSSVTLSGDAAAISQIQSMLEERKVFNRKLLVQTAYHSPHMRAISPAYISSLEGLEPQPENTDVLMFSSVTGSLVGNAQLGDPQYWASNMISPVKFTIAMQAALDYRLNRRGTARNLPFLTTLVEVGPHSALQGPIREILSSKENEKLNVSYMSILSRKGDAVRTALDAVGRLLQQGYPANVAKANNPTDSFDDATLLIDLPPFAWNHGQRFWYESSAFRAYRLRGLPRHDLVGVRSEHSSDLEPSWKNYLRIEEMPWIEHHKVQDTVLYPLSGMIVMAVEAIKQIADQTREIEGFHIRDVSFETAMVVPAEGGLETKLQFRPWRHGSRLPDAFWEEFTVSSRTTQGNWTKHCEGLISIQYNEKANPIFFNEHDAEAKRYRDEYIRISTAGLEQHDPKQLYAHLRELAFQFGPTFLSLVQVSTGHYEAHCVTEVTDTKTDMPENAESPHTIHPATLDGFIQMIMPASIPSGSWPKKAKLPRFLEIMYISNKFNPKIGNDITAMQ